MRGLQKEAAIIPRGPCAPVCAGSGIRRAGVTCPAGWSCHPLPTTQTRWPSRRMPFRSVGCNVGRSPTERLSMGPYIFGGLVWLPFLFLVRISRGPWFLGAELFGAIGPIVAFCLPVFWSVYRGRRSAGFPWLVAFAPLLLVVGSFSSYSVKQAIYGNLHDPSAGTVAPLVTLAGWCCVGVFLIVLGNLGGEGESEVVQPAVKPEEETVGSAVVFQIFDRLRTEGFEVQKISPRSWIVVNKERTMKRYFYSPEEFVQWVRSNDEVREQTAHEMTSRG